MTMVMSGFRLRGEVAGVQASFALGEGDNVVGSRLEGEVVVAERGVSRRHALLRVRAGRVEVEDLASKNGTFVNGERVRTMAVRVGDELRFGSVALVLEEVASGDADLAVRLETPRPEGGGAATTQGETARGDRVDSTWVAAIEMAAQYLPRSLCKAGPALRAFVGATGLAAAPPPLTAARSGEDPTPPT
ncbi:MAG TPA: FHA domain-containing protein, partial [Thermoanaerobaculaceae bacterium]|nr:FHA domain-containing protein [Thermoanaerobaculaceae bacterium]